MELKDFIDNFAEQFDETDRSEFQENTDFKGLEEWSSLSALTIIAMVDENYNVTVKGEDIRNSVTIKDLFELVNSRM